MENENKTFTDRGSQFTEGESRKSVNSERSTVSRQLNGLKIYDQILSTFKFTK